MFRTGTFGKKRRGYVLLTAMALVLVLAVIGMSVLTASLSSARLSARRHDSQVAFNLAETAFKQGVRGLIEDRTYTGFSNREFTGGLIRLTITTPTGTTKLRNVTAVGRVRSLGGQYIERSVSGIVDVAAISRIWDYAIIAKDAIELGGGPVVESTPINDQGNVHSNSMVDVAVDLSGSPMVRGKVSAVGGILVGSNATITRGYEAGADPVIFPEIDTNVLRARAATFGVRHGNLMLNNESVVTLSGIIEGNLKITSNPTITVVGPLWVTGTIEISGNGTTNLGNGLLVTEGGLKFSGGGSILGGNSLAFLSLDSSESSVDITGNTTVKGAIIAPDGNTKLGGGANIIGTLATKSLDYSGDPHFSRNTSYVPPDDLNTARRTLSWREN